MHAQPIPGAAARAVGRDVQRSREFWLERSEPVLNLILPGIGVSLVVNVGEELELKPAPEPLLAPPVQSRWEMAMSTDEPRFGGPGATNPCQSNCWKVPAECATLLCAVSSERR